MEEMVRFLWLCTNHVLNVNRIAVNMGQVPTKY